MLSLLVISAHATEWRRCAFHPIYDARALAQQVFPLAVGAPRVLFSEGGDPRHAATIRFATQPAQEDALQQLGVEPVCLGRSVLAGNRDTTDNGLAALARHPSFKSIREEVEAAVF